MTNRERVLSSLRHKAPDRVPYCISFTQKARAKMVRYYGDPQFDLKLDQCFAYVDTGLPNGWKEVAPDVDEDEFGVQWNRSVDRDIGVVCNCRITPDNLRDYRFPDPADPSRYARYTRTINGNQDRWIMGLLGFSLFERAWTLVGMENLLMAMITNPRFVHELLDRITEYNLGIIDRACAYPIDGMQFGDDWGQQSGLITGPDLWRQFIKPRLRQMYQRVKQKGKVTAQHSCGKVQELFPDMIECGLDIFNPFQPEVMSVTAMKKQFGACLTFYGGISTQKLLPYGTVAQVKQEVRRLLERVGEKGGLIAAPAHSIPGDAKPENMAAMMEVLQDQ